MTINIDIKCRRGQYLRWYFNGWHYWCFVSAEESEETQRERYNSEAGTVLVLGDEVTKAQLIALSSLMKSKFVEILTPHGWDKCLVLDQEIRYRADKNGALVEFSLKTWGRTDGYSD